MMKAYWLLALACVAIACAPELKDKDRFTTADAGVAEAAAPPVDAQPEATAAGCPDVPQMLVTDCAGAGCHSKQAKASALDLESPDVPGRLVGTAAFGGKGVLLDPRAPEQSVLYTKLTATPPFGEEMPSPAAPYDATRLACVRAWIATLPSDGGAPTGPPDASTGAAFYVDPAGDDTHAGDLQHPFKSIAKGASMLRPGDTLYLRAGVYVEAIIDDVPSGTASAPVTIAAYPNEKATLRPDSSATWGVHLSGPDTKYIVLDGLVIDAVNVTMSHAVKLDYTCPADGGPDCPFFPENVASHITLSNCEIMNSTYDGVRGGRESQFIHLNVHDNKGSGLALSDGRGNVIDACEIHNNAGGGISNYCGSPGCESLDDQVVKNSKIHDNACGGSDPAVGIYTGKNALVFDNLVWGNTCAAAITVAYSVSNARIFNNTIYDNRGPAVSTNDATATRIANNIFFRNDSPLALAAGATEDHNLADVDPMFVDEAGRDFHLRAGSPAIAKGDNLPEVTADLDGVPRPTTATDLGAFQYCDGGCSRDAGAPPDASSGPSDEPTVDAAAPAPVDAASPIGAAAPPQLVPHEVADGCRIGGGSSAPWAPLALVAFVLLRRRQKSGAQAGATSIPGLPASGGSQSGCVVCASASRQP